MIKTKTNHQLINNYSNIHRTDIKDKIFQTINKKDNKFNKPLVQRVTLKLITNQSDNQTSRSYNTNQQSKSNLFQQQRKTPKLKQFLPFKTNNIRTFVRFRPFSSAQTQISQQHIQSFSYISNNTSVAINDTIYSFDRVFKPDESQSRIFQQTTKDMIHKVLEGYNGTLFTYGQTGSGKTFTMFGDHRKGIIPLSAKQLFLKIIPEKSKITCSLLQIYRQTLIDLLDPEKIDLKIKQTSNGIQVMNLTVCQVKSQEQLMDAINKGNQVKKIRSTNINQHSSRSHFILILSIQQKTDDHQIIKSKLNLIDLAGSQKVNKSKAIGQSLQQAKKINLSLSCLSNTINALTKKNDHIPFRQSKLTRILQQSLVGNCITSLIVTCSSHITCLEQTLSSLKFGTRTKTIKTSVSKNIIKQQELGVKRQLYDSLKSQYQNCEQKLQKVKQVIQYAKRNSSHNSQKILNEIEYIVQQRKNLDEYEKRNRRIDSEEQNKKNGSILDKRLKQLQYRYEQKCIQLQNYRNIVVEQELLIEKQEQRLRQQQMKVRNYQQKYKIQLQLQQINRRQLQLLQKQKQSYHIFQKQILKRQINNLMNKIYPTNNQQDQIKSEIVSNNFRNQYINVLETTIFNYIKYFRKHLQKNQISIKTDTNISQYNLQKQFLPLTYQKAIQQIKNKNILLIKMIRQTHNIKQKQVLLLQNKKLRQKILILQNQLKYNIDINHFYQAYGQQKINLKIQILKPTIISHFSF